MLKIRNLEKKMVNKKIRGRKGVSEMLSYVLLICLGLFMAVALYSSLKLIANVKPVTSCEDGVSLTIIEYECAIDSFRVTLKNNGRFNVDGFMIRVSNNPDRVPITPLSVKGSLDGSNQGSYSFSPNLSPDGVSIIEFGNLGIPDSDFEILSLRIQPFIKSESGKANIVCENAVINQKINNCKIK